MTDPEINAAIAEACGWSANKYNSSYWTNARTKVVIHKTDLPSYCTDLNAMHEAENTLETEDRMAYTRKLYRDTGHPVEGGNSWYLAHATARQRAEAFLRTIGKWKE